MFTGMRNVTAKRERRNHDDNSLLRKTTLDVIRYYCNIEWEDWRSRREGSIVDARSIGVIKERLAAQASARIDGIGMATLS